MGTFGQSLGAYTFRYRGVEFGSGTGSKVVDLLGLFDTNVRDGDRYIPDGDGALRGNDYALPKEIIVDLRIEGPLTNGRPSAGLISRVDALEAAFQRVRMDEYPLEFNYPGEGQKFVNCRVISRTRPRRWSTELGIVQMAVRLKASDPRQYGIELKTETLLPYDTSGGGIDYPIGDYPKDFAVSAGAGDLVVQNGGNDQAWPLFRFYGPSSGSMTSVKVTNRTNGDVLEVVEAVAPGQILSADMSAAVDGSGRTVIDLSGSTRYGSWTPPRRPFALDRGSNVLRFEPTGTIVGVSSVVSFRDTYL